MRAASGPSMLRPAAPGQGGTAGGRPISARWLPGTVAVRRRWPSADFTKNSYRCVVCGLTKRLQPSDGGRRGLDGHSDPEKGVLSLPDEDEALAPSSNDVFEGPHQGFHDGSDAFLTC